MVTSLILGDVVPVYYPTPFSLLFIKFESYGQVVFGLN